MLAKLQEKPHWIILGAVAAAIIAGLSTSPDTVLLGVKPMAVYDFLGTLFLRALKMLVVPLITAAVITSVARAGSSADFGRLGGKAIAYYTLTTVAAVLTGLFFANLLDPGLVDGKPAKDLIGLTSL